MIPVIQITDQGYIAPTREEVAAGVWNMLRDAFGSNLNQDARTPQGQLVTSLTAAFTDRDNAFIQLGNNFDPRYSTGVWQEGLGAIYFLTRALPANSIAQIEFAGLADANVPAGTKVQDDNGVIWETTADGTVGAGGTVIITAKCSDTGPVAAAIGTINQLVESIPGIDRAENHAPAALGSSEESRVDFELRRAESVAANSKNTNQAVHGAVFDLNGVIDVYVVDNPTDDSITVGSTNYPMIRNSLLVSVIGGDDYDIAGAILARGGTGCAFEGNTEVLYKDTESWNDGYPPEYTVKFLRPEIKPLYFNVLVANRNAVTSKQVLDLQQSILSQLSAGENRARIGKRLIPASFICELARQLNIVTIRVSDDGQTWQDYIQYGVDEFPATARNMITVSQA